MSERGDAIVMAAPAPRSGRILFGTDRIRIEYFPAERPTDRVACVFVPGDTRKIGRAHV
jgi:hypothetical protein